MGLIKGIPVTLYETAYIGGQWTESAVTVENVLVEPISHKEGDAGTSLYGEGVYTLSLPKGDAHAWEGARCVFFGRSFRLYGLRREYIEALVPLDWNAQITAAVWDLNTPVRFCTVTSGRDAEGYPAETQTDVFGEGVTVPCKWLPGHGAEADIHDRLSVRKPATVWCRYLPELDERCILYRGDDDTPYEIVSMANIEDRDMWLEMRVQRREAAR